MLQLVSQIDEAVTAIRRHWSGRPQVGIVLGSGLGGLADEIESEASLGYDAIPHFAASTVIGHKGRLVCGRLAGVGVVAMQGRLHAYEGYSQQQITFPVRVMKALGAQVLIVSNACGGLNPRYAQGDVMVIDDHINLMWDNPLIGVNDERLGSRWPDMSCPYDPRLIARAVEIARRENFILHRGVYVAVRGPNYEPRAEYRLLRQIGADVVGMSTVPEVIVAVHGGMRVLGLSVVTNVCNPDNLQATDGKDVVAAAAGAGAELRTIVLGILQGIAGEERQQPGIGVPEQRRRLLDRVHFSSSVTGAARMAATPIDSAALAAMIDHTALKPEATAADVRKLCDEARQHSFASVCVNGAFVSLAAELLRGTKVNPIAVVGFPLGASTSLTKAFEATEAVNHGAREIDMVLHVGSLKAGALDRVREDISAVVASVKPLPVKVILETALLTPDEIVTACQIAKECGAAFVKTSTGFGPGGATVEAVELMRKTVGPSLGVKASGGIRSRADAERMVAAGANRLGTSASVSIVSGDVKSPGSY